MNDLNESLLEAWLRLSTSVINSRVVSELSYNESLICSSLYRNMKTDPSCQMTATDLCVITNMLKSQMNRTLNQLEAKNLITRQRSETDKRKVYILLNSNKLSSFEKQHQQILQLIDHIIEKLGVEKTEDAVTLLNQISDVAGSVLTKNK